MISLLRWREANRIYTSRALARNQSPKKQPKETAESAELLTIWGFRQDGKQKGLYTLRESLYYDGEDRGTIMSLSQVMRLPVVGILGLGVKNSLILILTHHLHLQTKDKLMNFKSFLPQLTIRIIKGTLQMFWGLTEMPLWEF